VSPPSSPFVPYSSDMKEPIHYLSSSCRVTVCVDSFILRERAVLWLVIDYHLLLLLLLLPKPDALYMRLSSSVLTRIYELRRFLSRCCVLSADVA
jgi:hypothetical protein